MTPKEIAALSASARKIEVDRLLKNPAVAEIVAERDSLKQKVADLEAQIAAKSKKGGAK